MILDTLLAFVIISATSVFGGSQQEFTLTATRANLTGSRALLDMPGLSDNPLAIIVATPLGDTELLNPNPLGAWYYEGKWNLFNSNQHVMPVGSKYRIQFFLRPGPNQFLHLVTKENIGAEGSYINNPALNGKPDVRVQILQNHAPEARTPYNVNAFEAKAEYSTAAGRWYIANVGGEPMPRGSAYNVVVSGGGSPSVAPPSTTPPGRDPVGVILNNAPPVYTPVLIPAPEPAPPVTPRPEPLPMPTRAPGPAPFADRWILREDAEPSISPNSEILLFIHGMDSRAEEADDITKALFQRMGLPRTQPPASTTANPMVPVLQQLLQKYKACILEKYETQQDMINRGLSGNLSGLASTNGLQDRDAIACVAGNVCTRASRINGFNALQTQASNGNGTNFEANLEKVIPKDCFYCAKHLERHTKHVHCTMEAGGNSGFPQGMNFEGCKAGVDIEALANSVVSDIHNIVVALAGVVPETQAVGGPSVATNYSTVRFTSCADPAAGCPEPCGAPDDFSGGQRRAVVPTEMVDGRQVPLYFEPMVPAALLDTGPPPNQQMNVPAAHNIGQNEGRLRPELRAAAAAKDPLNSLRLAAAQFVAGNAVMGNAYADLSVTGRGSFAKFNSLRPKESFCQSFAGQPGQDGLLNGCRTALDRAYRVANFLRTGQRGDTPALKTAKTNERMALGWIAVSGEDDSPHRPVNVVSSDFPQYDLDVTVEAPLASGPKSVTVRTRYVVAQSQAMNAAGKTLVMISLDLPTSGYAENLDYNVVSPLAEIGNPKWTPLPIPIVVPEGILYLVPGMPPIMPPGFVIPPGTPLPDFQATGRTPLLDFIENFIVRFTETLDQKTPIKNNIKAVMGGSLGGNMTFRLGRRPGVPWLPKFVVWSPASVWNSLGEGADLLKHFGPRTAWERANAAINSTNTGDRAEFFGGWDKPILPVIIPMAQSDTWTSDFYQCKKSSVAAARFDRQETYDRNFLAWHWRLGAEQLLYSHQTIDPTTNRPRYMSNQKPMLLACGSEDHVKFNDICPATQTTVPLMTLTPGKALFLDKTGHSLDNERRNFWALQIMEFLEL